MLTDTQKTELAKPLARAQVRTRKQGGLNVSYIEGWHAIAEANRIFGFDGWSSETVEVKCVSERDRPIGDNKAPGYSVTYIAKVRIRVGDVVREGCGSGHGIDRDCGQAHESAIKEAETDARKRALMTFGNVFGLALYDKEQANVCDDQHATSNAALDFIARIDECGTLRAMDNYGRSIAEQVAKLPQLEQEAVRQHFAARKKALTQAEGLAA